MKYFSIKILIACIILPPLFYVLTIRGLETYIEQRYTRQLENTYLGDTALLMNGLHGLRETIAENVDRFVKSRRLTHYGLNLQITVTTEKHTFIYPLTFQQEEQADPVVDPSVVAAENFRLMNEGLVLNLDAVIEPLSILSIVVLAGYLLCALLVLFIYYHRASGRLRREEIHRRREVETLQRQERETAARIVDLDHHRRSLNNELLQLKNTLQDEKQRASRNEDDLIEEVESLEKMLKENLRLQAEQNEEIENLKSLIAGYQDARKKSKKQKIKLNQAAGKRFKAVYKNLTLSERALDGFAQLSEELKIKAEEVIHQLNENPDKVTVKRKVFIGKSGKKTIMEVIFGYKGRLYFCKNANGLVEVLAVGTKNTQTRELEYLNNL